MHQQLNAPIPTFYYGGKIANKSMSAKIHVSNVVGAKGMVT